MMYTDYCYGFSCSNLDNMKVHGAGKSKGIQQIDYLHSCA